MKSRFTRKHRACGGIANCDIARFSKPPSCSHWCDSGYSNRGHQKRFGSRTRCQGQTTDTQWRKDVASQTPWGDERCAYAPWWSASGDLTARTIKARPAQGTPWWSASGVAPSFGCSIHLGVQVPTQRGVRARHRGHMPHGGQPVGT